MQTEGDSLAGHVLRAPHLQPAHQPAGGAYGQLEALLEAETFVLRPRVEDKQSEEQEGEASDEAAAPDRDHQVSRIRGWNTIG